MTIRMVMITMIEYGVWQRADCVRCMVYESLGVYMSMVLDSREGRRSSCMVYDVLLFVWGVQGVR